jgi:dienelactone hydrolase
MAGRPGRHARGPRRLLPILLLAALATAALAPASSDDYTDPAYLEHDLDNYTRARGRMITEGTDPAYHRAFASACLDSQGRAAVTQAADALQGRVYGGVGQATCWWSVGDAPDYFDVTPHRVTFLARTGAKLQGHVWGLDGAGPRPGVVITTGSIQASEQMYWWAARALAAAGYVVFTFDVQGQGQSETFSHAPGDVLPGSENVPSQQDANFFDGTIDALRFFLSTRDEPYVPVGWTDDDVARADAAAEHEWLDWVSPAAGVLDHDNLGIAGHSLGARAVSNVQMCSDAADLWRELELCAGRSYPIRAVVGWDALSSDVDPVVPGMSQQADGYFLFPTFTPQYDIDPDGSLAAFDTWTTGSNLDVFSYVVRGGTHIEWSQVPYTSATTYGVHANTYYTVAWMHRWVWPDGDVNQAAYRALVDGPLLDQQDPSRAAANYFSVRRFSGFRLTAPDRLPGRPGASDANRPGREPLQTRDIRHDYAGRSRIGDWEAANADTAGRVIADRTGRPARPSEGPSS